MATMAKPPARSQSAIERFVWTDGDTLTLVHRGDRKGPPLDFSPLTAEKKAAQPVSGSKRATGRKAPPKAP